MVLREFFFVSEKWLTVVPPPNRGCWCSPPVEAVEAVVGVVDEDPAGRSRRATGVPPSVLHAPDPVDPAAARHAAAVRCCPVLKRAPVTPPPCVFVAGESDRSSSLVVSGRVG